MRKITSALFATFLSAAPLFATAPATAAPITITDQMDSSATYRGGDYGSLSLANFANRAAGGKHWGDELYNDGHRFDTTAMTLDRNTAAGTLTITLHTRFNGDDSGARYADLFIDTRTPGAPDGFNYAIALGAQTMAAGFYSVGTAATANDIWGGQGSYVYGGYAQLKADAPGFNPAMAMETTTRLTSGALVAGSSTTVTRNDLGNGFFDLTVALKAASLDLFNNFDIYWGTGDCGNDSIWGSVATAPPAESPVDAPAAITLLCAGLAGLGLQRRAAVRAR